MASTVRIGIIGAGAFTQQRHIPKLQEIPGVEIVAVCNRTPESVQRVAREFHIPQVFTDWREVIALADIHAVLIGTPPYFHHTAVLAALDAGKHVLCEGRMATSLREAREMYRFRSCPCRRNSRNPGRSKPILSGWCAASWTKPTLPSMRA
ncbi:MAG: Gfo/Idh/MocA family oxidoreductase [Chloroflexi bacterium]|nr:Gfo/Idh/MocA family oxidoreductase [Chloroflexota bacterium]